ncbi:MAG TPA: hypothetical protein VN782_04760, partial [Usitatibacter sp.]|nr:hypothetical protein [Usitatibacter sp.]
MKKIRVLATALVAAFVSCFASLEPAQADPFPPFWNSAAVHFPPVAWPSEPADPKQCGATCGEWKPYTRFQAGLADARTQDPSNGGTAPQNYVNISSSCIDKAFPSIYYSLHEGATPDDDVIMFRWRVEQIANNYATGPSAGTFGASDPWSSALWSVLFDVDGDGYIDLAAHLDGSSGAPATAVDRIFGIWSSSPTQSLDYVNDPTVKLIAHNPTAFVDSATSRLLNFNPVLAGLHTAAPDANWPNGSAETTWDYGTTRSKVVTTSPCNEYFVDYQIPVKMLDASSLGGPKITRSTPISMLFCTANSLNNPFQKDCAINRQWVGAAGKPGPFGDYISFDQANPYSQPIVSKVTAQGPNTCPGTYLLSATVQDTLAVVNGTVVPSVKAVRFYYYYDANADGVDNDGGAWTFAADATLKAGSLNTWTASWDATSLPRGQFLIGVQALDDNTIVDDGMTPTGVDNRTFSYVAGDAQNRIFVNGVSFATLPTHSPAMSTSASENWWGNPSVTGTQTALVGVALNACGVAPALSKTASVSNVATGGTVDFTLTITNALSSALAVSQLNDPLPSGFSYVSTIGGTLAPTTSPTAGAAGTLTWSFSPSAAIPAGGTGTIVFRATAPPTAGTYSNTATATTSFGTLTSGPAQVNVDGARLSLTKTPSAYLAEPDGATPLTYTLHYSNDSSVQVTSATISDAVPAGATYVSCSGGTTCANAGGTVTWSLGTLAGGASGSVGLTVTVPASYTSPSLANTANLSATDPAGSPASASATSTVAVDVPHPNIVLQKSASTPVVAPGGSVTYTLGYSNTGSSGASNVVITDVVPSGFTFVSATGGGTNSLGTVTWNIGAVAAGAGGSVTITLQAANPYSDLDPQTNTASVTWTGNTTPVAASTQTGVSQSTNVCSAFYFRSTTASVGFDGTRQLATTSPVPAATDAGGSTSITVPGGAGVFSATVLSFYEDPASAADVSLTGNLTTNMYIDRKSGPGITIRATVYDYDSTTGARTQLGQSSTSFTGSQTGLFTFTVPLTGTLSKAHRLLWTFEAASNNNQNTTLLFQYGGTVRNGVSDPTGTTTTLATSSASFCTTPPANLVFAKTVDKTSAAPGDTLTYTLSFANTSGSTAATGATIVDTLPAGLAFSSATLNGSPITPTGTNPYTFTVGSSGAAVGTIAAGASGTLVIAASVANPLDASIASLTNNASLASAQTSAINASATTGIAGRGAAGGAPALAITLAADRTTAAPGDTVTYTVTVVNIGTAGASSVTVSDALPTATYYNFGACSGGCSNAGGTLSWNVGSLAVGASASNTFTMIAGSTGLPAGVTVIPDTASTAATGVATLTSNTVKVTLDGNPILTLSKSASPTSGLAPGGAITYSLVVANVGSAAASDVVVRDPIPSNASYAGSITATAGSGAFDPVANQVVFSVGSLATGASATLTFHATVSASLAAGSTTISNTATASSSNAPSRSASASVSASAAPVLTLSKSGPAQVAFPAATLSQAASGTTVRVNDASQLKVGELVSIGGTLVAIDAIAGNVLTVDGAVSAPSGTSIAGTVTYSIVYANTGNTSANGVILTDTLPSGTTFVSATNGGANAGGTVTWSLASIDAGTSGVVQVTILPSTTGSLTNQASIACASCNTATASVTTAIGGLVVAKRTTTPTASAGGSAAYIVDVTNTSSAAIPGVTVTDVLSSGFTYASTTSIVNDGTPVSATTSPTVGDGTLAWGTFTIQPGKTLSVSYAVDVGPTVGAATYQNQAGATPIGSTVPFDALATTAEDVTVLGLATGIVQGYVFQDLDNNGIFDATVDLPLGGVSVTITDSTGTAFTVATDSNGFYTRVVATGAASVDVNDADIPAGLTRGATFTDPTSVTVPAGSSVESDTGYVSTSSLPDLTIAKSHAGNFAQGETGASYTLAASNAGTGPTVGTVTVTDTLPAGLAATAIAGTNWSCTLATLTCTRSDALAAGASYEPITVTVNVAGGAAASLVNSASVGGGGETNTANDTASDPTTVDAVADVGVTKTDGVSSVTAGGTTTYTVVVSNAGPGSANGALLTDAAVAGLAKTAVACVAAGGAVCPASPTVGQLESGLAIPALPAGGSVAFTVAANVTASAGTNVSNTAVVAPPAGTTDPNAANDSAT